MDLDIFLAELESAFRECQLPPPQIEMCKDDVRVSGFGIIKPDDEYEVYDLLDLGNGPLRVFRMESDTARFVAKEAQKRLR